MVKLTLIARVSDGLPLAEGLDSDKDHELDSYKQQAKVSSYYCPPPLLSLGLPVRAVSNAGVGYEAVLRRWPAA